MIQKFSMNCISPSLEANVKASRESPLRLCRWRAPHFGFTLMKERVGVIDSGLVFRFDEANAVTEVEAEHRNPKAVGERPQRS